MALSICIRDFEPGDAAALVAIQQTADQAAQWPAADYEGLARQAGGLILIARPQNADAAVGFLAARSIGEEAELYNLAVLETLRHSGIGKCLMQEFHRRLAASGARRAACEVRASNVAALNLYRAFGYVRSGVRRNYYSNNGED